MIEKKKEKEKEEKKIIDVPDLDTAALHHHHPLGNSITTMHPLSHWPILCNLPKGRSSVFVPFLLL